MMTVGKIHKAKNVEIPCLGIIENTHNIGWMNRNNKSNHNHNKKKKTGKIRREVLKGNHVSNI